MHATTTTTTTTTLRMTTFRRVLEGPLSRHRKSHLARPRVRYVSQFSSSGPGIPGLDDEGTAGEEEDEGKSESTRSRLGGTAYKMFEAAATTFASLTVLGALGYGYHRYYKALVLRKMAKAFAPGDPVLDIAQSGGAVRTGEASAAAAAATADEDGAGGGGQDNWILRPEQAYMDAIINGDKRNRYYLLVGEKGTGKSSMIIEAMRKIDGEGVSMFEAHADLEIFRIRLGKSLNYEFYEDYIGSLFSVRGPRDTTALLDIERAFNKLEKIALKHREKKHKPIILIVNGVHLIRDDDDGRDLLELMQQRAEAWAAANLATVVFNSDEYWVYERLKRHATRMEVLPIPDLPKNQAIAALSKYRSKYFPEQEADTEILSRVYESVGGRLNFLNRVAKSSDMMKMCEAINEGERTWFLNKCGILGESMDDDVMDQQKYASAAMVLARALVEQEKEEGRGYDLTNGHRLPEMPLYIARQVMTRADFIQSYDHDNIFTIDSHAMVRADSVPMMNAFRQICSEEGFDKYLEDTLDRISAIESINRTKEVTLKDLWVEQSGEMRGTYEAVMTDIKGRPTGKMEFKYKPKEEDSDGGDND